MATVLKPASVTLDELFNPVSEKLAEFGFEQATIEQSGKSGSVIRYNRGLQDALGLVQVSRQQVPQPFTVSYTLAVQVIFEKRGTSLKEAGREGFDDFRVSTALNAFPTPYEVSRMVGSSLSVWQGLGKTLNEEVPLAFELVSKNELTVSDLATRIWQAYGPQNLRSSLQTLLGVSCQWMYGPSGGAPPEVLMPTMRLLSPKTSFLEDAKILLNVRMKGEKDPPLIGRWPNYNYFSTSSDEMQNSPYRHGKVFHVTAPAPAYVHQGFSAKRLTEAVKQVQAALV